MKNIDFDIKNKTKACLGGGEGGGLEGFLKKQELREKKRSLVDVAKLSFDWLSRCRNRQIRWKTPKVNK